MEIKKGQITRIFNGEIITPDKNLGIGTVLTVSYTHLTLPTKA